MGVVGKSKGRGSAKEWDFGRLVFAVPFDTHVEVRGGKLARVRNSRKLSIWKYKSGAHRHIDGI